MELVRQNSLRQSQTITITPEVIQSIQVLQYGQDELQSFLKDQIERNPLLEMGGRAAPRTSSATLGEHSQSPTGQLGNGISRGRGSVGGRREIGFDQAPNLEQFCASKVSLREHLRAQLAMTCKTGNEYALAVEIVESIDPDGYLRRSIGEIASSLGVEDGLVESALEIVHRLEPSGVGARNLPECLRLQLREIDRLDPAMDAFLDHLQLLAEYNMKELSKVCGVDHDDVLEMAKEIRALDPRPGLQFDHAPLLPALPDVLLEDRADGRLGVRLNAATMPRVLIDREYYSMVSGDCSDRAEKQFIMDCWKSANWLTRNLDQRAQTILKVATEIVRKQKDFFTKGADHLKPLNLKEIADAVGLHESTVSRATANKYLMTGRGMFELKFFFSNSIASADGNDSFSSETVRHKIKSLINAETADTVLSDDAIVNELRRRGVDIARRTIAKYRESMNIGSSLQRRRQKMAALEAV